MRVGAVGALWAAAVLWGCGTAPVTGGAAVDAAGSDAAGADGVAGDAASSVDAASTSDTTTSADTPGDTAADASSGDAPSVGDAQAGDGGDLKGDGGGSVDAAADAMTSDASTADAPGADGKDSGDATPGPYSCESACGNIAKAACPADDPVASCVEECVKFTGETPPACAATIQELLKCVSTASITCKDGGKSDSSVCNYLAGQLEKCASGGPPPDPCPAGNCYSSAGPNGLESCGCDTTCFGSQVKLDCAAGKCSCTTNGKVTANFDDAAVCLMNPWETLKSACGLPTGP